MNYIRAFIEKNDIKIELFFRMNRFIFLTTIIIYLLLITINQFWDKIFSEYLNINAIFILLLISTTLFLFTLIKDEEKVSKKWKLKREDIYLFITGQGKMRKKLEKFVRDNNLSSNIKFLGFIPDLYLPKWYSLCQLTIVPSIFEGFGLTVIESLACGTPVIATNVDGIRDIIKNNKNVILVEYNNKKELAKQVVGLLNNPLLRKEFSKEGLKTIKKKFDLDKIAENTLEMYKNVKN